jgi:thiol:disulfide interchange protein
MTKWSISCLAAALATAGLLFGGPLSAGEVKWAKSFDEAYETAKKENKPVMIDVYTDWCGWCKRLDKDVYTAANVVQLSEKFVCFKLNPDKDPAHGDLFKVEGYPAIIFTDPDRKEVSRISGYVPADEFAKEMEKALKAFPGAK